MTYQSSPNSRLFQGRRVGVLMGGRSAEREVSLQSGAAVLEALSRQGFEACGVDLGDNPCQQLRDASIDVAFVALHGRFGEDGCIQGLLESMGIPYTGSSVLASAMAMDKVVSKRLFDGAGLPTPAWAFPATEDNALALGLPVVIKPRAEGSSVGLMVARTPAELRSALGLDDAPEPQNSGLMVERYVEGRELTVGVFGTGVQARTLDSVEIRAASGTYDYEAKYQRNDTEYLVPAPVNPKLTSRLNELALAAHRLLECRGATRADFRWSGRDGDDPLLLEINTLPGMTGHSLLPKMAEGAGLSYDELVQDILVDAGLKA